MAYERLVNGPPGAPDGLPDGLPDSAAHASPFNIGARSGGERPRGKSVRWNDRLPWSQPPLKDYRSGDRPDNETERSGLFRLFDYFGPAAV